MFLGVIAAMHWKFNMQKYRIYLFFVLILKFVVSSYVK